MAKHYIRVANVFSEGELVLLEDALRKYEQSEAGNLSEIGRDVLGDLKQAITTARRWVHQFGKVDHND